jgi:hypothetical protein
MSLLSSSSTPLEFVFDGQATAGALDRESPNVALWPSAWGEREPGSQGGVFVITDSAEFWRHAAAEDALIGPEDSAAVRKIFAAEQLAGLAVAEPVRAIEKQRGAASRKPKCTA